VNGFEAAARKAVRVLTREQVEELARWIEGDAQGSSLMDEVTTPPLREVVSNVLATLNLSSGQIRPLAASYIRALSDGYLMGLAEREQTRTGTT
jgi:hypothetical protein